MTVEFISGININPSNELNRLRLPAIDVPFLKRYARTLDEGGFDYTLVPYHSSYQDPFTLASAITQFTERLKPIVALRPNTIYPTVAAKQLATLDQLSGGRAVVHFIAGGDDSEQAREGDRLSKTERYARQAEYIDILRRVWTSTTPFDHAGTYYSFEDFVSVVRPVNGTIPVSVGGSSQDAYRVGGAQADIFGLWGEPLKETKEQIDAVAEQARLAGRKDTPRIWVTFRPIIAPTDELAWEKAHRILGVLQGNNGVAHAAFRSTGQREPANVGSQRLLRVARDGDLHDRALWTPTASATNATGASTALVGTPETVAAAILDYVDLGAELISIRGYDNFNDVVDYGRYIIPLVREELAHRETTGRRGEVVREDAGLDRLAAPAVTSRGGPPDEQGLSVAGAGQLGQQVAS
ncbi:LLM class flavin-dependent oxidoreductase [Protofrankia symbiont of Coriaria ruscifolia]|uniref:Flavin-dependent oxidoreductase, F420-dependent methylene-tetrahydromethanopterin reductase n=1 Tax=Candidatus Protofrankia californiensis TaxID=1839754 RepID=A0A1C3NXV9_9ACTN|nr:LLM class flavin-dependent oxidoreductase [Protofrankia symbiont of Coriaria ruscifolia]SBW22409.1 flavin-dependent oxidoreductase, F420-dependent methylene-tetrahydromethanopterin reductase [Candidatus Protofrankia californiensis]